MWPLFEAVKTRPGASEMVSEDRQPNWYWVNECALSYNLTSLPHGICNTFDSVSMILDYFFCRSL